MTARLVVGGKWGVRQKLTDGEWGGGTVGMGYERVADADADVERMRAYGYEAEVYDRWVKYSRRREAA